MTTTTTTIALAFAMLLAAAWITGGGTTIGFRIRPPLRSSSSRGHRRPPPPPLQRNRGSARAAPPPVIVTASSTSSFDRDDEESTTTIRTVRAEVNVASEDLPGTSRVDEIFRSTSVRDALVACGGDDNDNDDRVVERRPTPAQLEIWRRRCSALNATRPDENDRILLLSTASSRRRRGSRRVAAAAGMLGVTVEVVKAIGAKYISGDDEEESPAGIDGGGEMEAAFDNPRYELVLLAAEKSVVSGFPPALVWILNKLEGKRKEEIVESSFSTVTYEENEDGTIVFLSDSVSTRTILGGGAAFVDGSLFFDGFLRSKTDPETERTREARSMRKALYRDVSRSLYDLERAYTARLEIEEDREGIIPVVPSMARFLLDRARAVSQQQRQQRRRRRRGSEDPNDTEDEDDPPPFRRRRRRPEEERDGSGARTVALAIGPPTRGSLDPSVRPDDHDDAKEEEEEAPSVLLLPKETAALPREEATNGESVSEEPRGNAAATATTTRRRDVAEGMDGGARSSPPRSTDWSGGGDHVGDPRDVRGAAPRASTKRRSRRRRIMVRFHAGEGGGISEKQ
eukprot:CAMPEP_0197177428 /NCGR_PEP_ID=MMETSP1423-20130617/3033_1 /TAXON_ID=476441 /ORGANISM="Pseudo-nitzschia heimii, Strain UNC1101" /LENGTH=569 /DNA_ID=CAMNT_0042626969 /DNA_START=26 /DNA_END=1739 /DNA_ORIENTATION=+